MPLLVLIAVLVVAGVAVSIYASGSGARTEKNLVRRYISDWTDQNYAGMYGMLADTSTAGLTEAQFKSQYATADDTATLTSLQFGERIDLVGKVATIPVTVRTSTFGTLHEVARIDLVGDGHHVSFTPDMVFPGLQSGETLSRTSTLGTRGNLLASNGQVLARGSSLSTDLPDISGLIVGELEAIPDADRAYYESLGYPATAEVGKNGLEAIFQKELAGTPGGTLKAGDRVLASAAPKDGKSVRTTINPVLEADVNAALGQSYAGMVVMNRKTGAIEAAVGLAFSVLQPPGSTFKIITAAAALQYGVATPSTEFPVGTEGDIGGYEIQNAGGESCGGTLTEAFVTSCDSTFGPLGVTVGAPHMLAMAEKFGFNQPTGIAGALESTIPTDITTAGGTALGMAAIGQWQVQASPLEIADVGATIANHGERPIPTFDASAPPRYVKAVSEKVAGQVEQMMVGVVEDSAGTAYGQGVPGYTEAGKTGTAELASTVGQQNDSKETDAWFVGYLPGKSDLVACALFPADGYGADSAAPAVQDVLAAAVGAG